MVKLVISATETDSERNQNHLTGKATPIKHEPAWILKRLLEKPTKQETPGKIPIIGKIRMTVSHRWDL